MKIVTIQIQVEVPDDTPDQNVADLINEALDEPPCDWTNWTVGSGPLLSSPAQALGRPLARWRQ